MPAPTPLAAALALAVALSACSERKVVSAAPPDGPAAPGAEVRPTGRPPALPPPEGRLDLIAWPGYVERGASDKAYDWVTRFERETGCQVNVKSATTSDEMVALMAQGGFDLVTASGDASLRLVAARLVQPIDPALIPSYWTVDERLQRAAWHTVDGVHYGVPYQWGPNVLMYSTKVFKTPPTSWAVVFEPQRLPDGKPNKGRVQAYDGPIYLADAALYLAGKRPELGIKDPYELDPMQYAAALDLLRGQRPLVQRYWHDATAQMSDFKYGGVVASGSWGYMVNGLQAQRQPVASTIPAEGSTGWADTTMLHAAAAHPGCAYRWLEWSLTPWVQVALGEWFGSVPVVPAACRERPPGGTDVCRLNGFDRFGEIRFWKTPTAACASQKACVPYSQWVIDYLAIQGGRERAGGAAAPATTPTRSPPP